MIIFRADGNAQIGSGHVMRCLAIADVAKEMGEEILFITASNDMSAVIKSRSYHNIVLDTDYRNLESEDILSVLSPCSKPIVFVDSYYISEQYLQILRNYCKEHGGRLVYIDDIKKFAYPCDVLINYHIHGLADEYNRIYSGHEKPKYVMGTSYIPLRKEFLLVKEREIKREANTILVSTGGSDPEHMSIELLRIAKHTNKTFHFVMGAVNKDKPLIIKEAQGCSNIVLHENVNNMSELMQSCDVAISAAGSTLYELCATQTPTITYVLADNQAPIAEGFSSRRIIKNCGDIRECGAQELAWILIKNALTICDNYAERVMLSEKMKNVVDGNGAKRILEAVKNL